MDKNIFPKIICSSVIRSSNKGESHGGVYIVDLETNKFEKVINFNDETIDWQGRGGDRGLRGIAFYKGNVILAASDEIFFYDKNFYQKKSYKNNYLKHCHEIFVHKNLLYVTSTGFDSILIFDLEKQIFTKGFCIRKRLKYLQFLLKKFRSQCTTAPEIELFKCYPNKNNGPKYKETIHINNTFFQDNKIFFSGTKLDGLFYIKDDKIKFCSKIPKTTHNVMFWNGNLLFNSTRQEQIINQDDKGNNLNSFEIKKYNNNILLHNELSDIHAKQAFGRGLATYKNLIIGGSSPATISIYKTGQHKAIKTINLTLDMRNAIHGLEIWPY